MANRNISATEFKAKCLALLDEVQDSGDVLTVTKRGRPVATVQRAKKKFRSLEGILAGKFELPDDLENINFADDWNVLQPGFDPEDPFQLNTPLPEKTRLARRRKAS